MQETNTDQSVKLRATITFANPINSQKELDAFFVPMLNKFVHDAQIFAISDFGSTELSCEITSTIHDPDVDMLNETTRTMIAISEHTTEQQSVTSFTMNDAEITTCDSVFTFTNVTPSVQ